MRQARVYVHGTFAGMLLEERPAGDCLFRYDEDYDGPPVSLALPLAPREHRFAGLPAFFEGLLPEGDMLEGLLRQNKIDRTDTFAQLIAVGKDTVGAVTIEADTA